MRLAIAEFVRYPGVGGNTKGAVNKLSIIGFPFPSEAIARNNLHLELFMIIFNFDRVAFSFK